MRTRDTISESYVRPFHRTIRPYLHCVTSQGTATVTYLDKVKGICSCLGVGTPAVKPGTVQEAMFDIKSKAMLKYSS